MGWKKSLHKPNKSACVNWILNKFGEENSTLVPAEAKQHGAPKWSSDLVWRTHYFVLKAPVTQKDHLWKDLCRWRDQRHWKEQKGVGFGPVIYLDGRKRRKVGHWASRSVKHRWHHSYTSSGPLLIKQPLRVSENSSNLCQHTSVTG